MLTTQNINDSHIENKKKIITVNNDDKDKNKDKSIDIQNINDSYIEEKQIESINCHLNLNSYIKIIVPIAIFWLLY